MGKKGKGIIVEEDENKRKGKGNNSRGYFDRLWMFNWILLAKKRVEEKKIKREKRERK